MHYSLSLYDIDKAEVRCDWQLKLKHRRFRRGKKLGYRQSISPFLILANKFYLIV
jgi:hypothetical protein